MQPCRTSVCLQLDRMHLLGILIDRLRAMREPHPMDVRVSASAGTPARADGAAWAVEGIKHSRMEHARP
jgi:hypothetical protein